MLFRKSPYFSLFIFSINKKSHKILISDWRDWQVLNFKTCVSVYVLLVLLDIYMYGFVMAVGEWKRSIKTSVAILRTTVSQNDFAQNITLLTKIYTDMLFLVTVIRNTSSLSFHMAFTSKFHECICIIF